MSTKRIVSSLVAVGLASIALGYDQYPYFPVTKNSWWTYDNGKKVVITETSETPTELQATVSNTPEAGYVRLRCTATLVDHMGYSNPDYIMVAYYFAQSPLLDMPLTQGKTWAGSLTSNGYPINFVCRVTTTNATTSAGGNVFSNCVAVNVVFEYPNGYDWSSYVTNRLFHFAKNVGCIRRDDSWTDGSQSSIQLSSYRIATTPTNPVPVGIWTAVEITWPSVSNEVYQVQYTHDLVSGGWTNLGAEVDGNGTTNSAFDSIRSTDHRFYRVLGP